MARVVQLQPPPPWFRSITSAGRCFELSFTDFAGNRIEDVSLADLDALVRYIELYRDALREDGRASITADKGTLLGERRDGSDG